MDKFDNLPVDLKKSVFNFNFTEYKIEVICSLSSMAWGDENRPVDDNYDSFTSERNHLILDVFLDMELTLPPTLHADYLNFIIEGSEQMIRGTNVRVGNEPDMAMYLHAFLQNERKNILKANPDNPIKYIEFEEDNELSDREDRTILFPIRFQVKKGFIADDNERWITPDEFETKIQPIKELCITAIHHIVNYGPGFIDRTDNNQYYAGAAKKPLFSPPDTQPMELFTFQKTADGDNTEQPLVSNKTGKYVADRSLYQQDQRLRSCYKLKTSSFLLKKWLRGCFRDFKMTHWRKIDVPLNHEIGSPINPPTVLENEYWEQLDIIPPVAPGRSFWLWTGMENNDLSTRNTTITLVDNRQLPLSRGVNYGNAMRKLKF